MINKIYYGLKPIIPRWFQIVFRRIIVDMNLDRIKDVWPIYDKANWVPSGWKGWPDKKQFALILTHDVDTQRGENRCSTLMKLEKQLGFRSTFFFVPGIHNNQQHLRTVLKRNKFEVGIHGLHHDGKLFQSRKIFQKRAERINQLIKEWKVLGFRSPSMHHNLTWIQDLNILYDASTFDVDPFEPQSDGVGTIFPFIVNDQHSGKWYVELPYTLPQDFTIFVLMKQKNIDIWKRKLDWIAENRGMAHVITHPDYMNFDGGKSSIDEYHVDYYLEFLFYIKNKYQDQYWLTLPSEMAKFWSSQMNNNHDEKRMVLPNKVAKSAGV